MIHGVKLVEACLPELRLGGGFMLDKIVEKKVIGIKQCLKFIKLGKGKVLYVANDADARLISPLIAKKENIKIVEISTMKELGLMSGIEVRSAATLIIEK
jgi:large subunit ribosomal protein L7A